MKSMIVFFLIFVTTTTQLWAGRVITNKDIDWEKKLKPVLNAGTFIRTENPKLQKTISDSINSMTYHEGNHSQFFYNLVISIPDKDPMVFGFSEKDVLNLDNDPRGGACSDDHNHDDWSNRWCHAIITKMIKVALEEAGLETHLAALAGASIFVYKEFYYDLHPSMADLVVPEFNIYTTKDKKCQFNLTPFFDKVAFVNIDCTFDI